MVKKEIDNENEHNIYPSRDSLEDIKGYTENVLMIMDADDD